MFQLLIFRGHVTGSTISTLFHDKINPKDCQVLSLGDSGFLQFFRVVSSDYGTPRVSFRECIFFFPCLRLRHPAGGDCCSNATGEVGTSIGCTWGPRLIVVDLLGMAK